MPFAPPRQCTAPGCRELVAGGKCAAHAKQYDILRGTSRERGYTSKWAKASRAWRRGEHPDGEFHLEQLFCSDPFGGHGGSDRVIAECVDHIQAHKGDMRLFWDQRNWQSLCLKCNSRKAALEEGGFGNGARGPAS